MQRFWGERNYGAFQGPCGTQKGGGLKSGKAREADEQQSDPVQPQIPFQRS